MGMQRGVTDSTNLPCLNSMLVTSAAGARRALSSAAAKPVLRGVVFDMDGTLTVPNLDFGLMYQRCGVDRSQDILAAIEVMPPAEKAAAQAIVEEMEEEGRRTLQLAPGARECADWLRSRGIRTALVTRNTAKTVRHLHRALWEPAGLPPFWPAISRDDPLPPKPNTAALSAVADAWRTPLGPELLMVGDSPANDVAFGVAAGIATALVDSGRRLAEKAGAVTAEHAPSMAGADLVVHTLDELPALLEHHFVIEPAAPLAKYPKPEPTTIAALAAAGGDLDELYELSDAQVLATDEHGNTPLIWAAEFGHVEATKLLLARGVAPNARGYLGATALQRAARNGEAATIEALLTPPPSGVTTWSRYTELVDPDVPNDKRQYPLHHAAFKRQPEAVTALLAAGASTTVCDRKGRTPAEDTADESIRDAILAERARRAASFS